MPKSPGQQGKPGGGEHGGNRPGKPKGPDKLSGGGIPPGKEAMRGPRLFNVTIAEAVWMRDEGWMGEHVREIHEWTITIEGTSYRCVIRECPCGLRRQIGVVYKPVPNDAPDFNTRTREVERVHSVLLTNCTCRSEAHRGVKPSERDRVCHGWHRARIDKVFGEIARPQKVRTSLRSYAGSTR